MESVPFSLVGMRWVHETYIGSTGMSMSRLKHFELDPDGSNVQEVYESGM